ncbi:MAG: glycosyltransferase family 39 protein, partial [Deltaproteobacteria bacterium]|nr:glycosyltransferase family 39 protein [Deltaproteobacteria bacterium]
MKGFNPYFSNKYRELLIGMVLVLAVACVYSQVANHEFVNIDDHVYVTNNPQVQSGLSLANMQWAFRFHKTDKVYWHPLVWISHMTDIQLFGLNPGAHHLVNVLFHMLNTLLLFIVLRRMTGSVWSSAFVAALFALHPINVDSVAWIAERKNVLSTFFWLCTMIAYLHYTKTPGIFRYLILVMVFTLGLLTKPMLATLPCVLLLLDYWPLGRIKWSDQGITSKAELILTNCREVISSRVIWEKIPLGVLSLAAIGISSMRLEAAGNVMPFSVVPLTFRIENALVSYVRYIGKMLWPLDLAVLYPFPRSFPLEQTFAAAIALTSITAITLKFWKKYPYLVVGWLWFAGTLIPVSGLMMAGLWPAMADRWVYVPLIGLFVMISWGIPDLLKGNPFCTYFIPAAAGATLLLLAILTFNQTATWRNSRVLFEHAVAVTTGNHMAHNNLGNIFMEH